MKAIIKYFSLVKFSHTIFSLPFAIIGFFSAVEKMNAYPNIVTIIAIFLCLILARNSAMAFNRWLDRKYDSLNPRTKNREIPTKIISPISALNFIIINSILFIISTLLINTKCFYLSPVALFVIFSYSYMKRISWGSHFMIGLALMIAPIGAYISVTETIDLNIILLGLVVLFWVSGFDILYSIQDEDFDKEYNLHSIPSKYGRKKAILFSRISHIISILFLFTWWFLFYPSIVMLIGTIIFSLILLLQNFSIKISKNDKINEIFFNYNGIASIIFCLFFLINHFFV